MCFIVVFGSTVIFVGVSLMYLVISCCIYIFTVIVHLNNTKFYYKNTCHLWFDSVTNVIIFDIALIVFKLQTVGVCKERSWWAHLPIKRLPETCLQYCGFV